MKCAETTNIGPMLDGELDKSEAKRLSGHAGVCSECGAERKRLLALSGLMRQSPAIAAPLNLEQRILTGFRRIHPKPISWFTWIFLSRVRIPVPAIALLL